MIFSILAGIACAQDNSNLLHVTGLRFVGKTMNGENIREVHGNVVMTQGNIKITCDSAIQYLAKNTADLMGNVVVTQDSIVIKTDRGFYYGDTKIAYSTAGIWLTDKHVQLTSQNGYYYFNEKKSDFNVNVKMVDSVSTLLANRLFYFDDEDKAVAFGNVQVNDTSSTIFADSLIFFRKTRTTHAFNHVRIYDPSNHLALFGDQLENLDSLKYSKITGHPFMVKIDTTSNGKFDTLYISSRQMESYGDSAKKLIATDSVKILRGDFSSVNGQTFYYQQGDKLQIFKREKDEHPPIIWNDQTQLIGDSINIYLKKNRLDWIDVKSNSSIISIDRDSLFRYDQISGNNLKLFFNEEGLNRTEVEGNVLSIYYLYEKDQPNGLLKSSAERAKIFFKDKKVNDVKLYGKPVSEYHPENMIEGKEKDFTIPTFRLYKNKPTKKEMLGYRKDVIHYLTKDQKYYAGKPGTKK
jgi:lipopolysaccharide export system protein LptA